MSRERAIFVMMALLASSAAHGQTLPIFGNEIFITIDNDTAFGWVSGIRDIIVKSPDDSTAVIDFIDGVAVPCPTNATICLGSYLNQIGYGTYGPICADGELVFEPFWYSSVFGNLGGLLLFGSYNYNPAVTPPGFLPYSLYMDMGVGNRMGLRIARADGRPIGLVGFNYLTVPADIEIGTQLVTYADFANFQRFTPTTNSPQWLPQALPPIPDNIERIEFGSGSVALNFNIAAGTFSGSATIASLLRGNGTLIANTSADVLVGGALNLTGSYIGADVTALSDVTITSASWTLSSSTGVDQLILTSPLARVPSYWTLGGTSGAFPFEHPLMTEVAVANVSRVGSGSAALDSLALRWPFERATIEFNVGSQGPTLRAIDKPFRPLPSGVIAAWSTSGTGDVHFGAANIEPGSTLRNFVDLSPQGAVGAGSFFGLAFDTDLVSQFPTPLGVHPLNVFVSGSAYFWGVPSATIPAGLTVDLVTLELQPNGAVTFAGPWRLVF